MAKQDFTITANIPDGWEPTGEYRCPRKGEWYLYFPHTALEARDTFIVERYVILRKIEPVRESRWINAYRCDYTNEGASRHRSRVVAKAAQGGIRVPLIRIDYENGVPVHVALEPAEGEG